MARYIKHVITRGDTIQSISNKYTGGISFWRDIVEYNNLKHPYIVFSVGDKIEKPEHLVTLGDTIIIPVEQNLLENRNRRFNAGDRDKIIELSLGSDVSGIGGDKAYQQYGLKDEVFELSGDGKGDIALARGVENVKQAVIARLLTRVGSLNNHPTYGSELETLIGSPINMMTLRLVDDEIMRTIKKDGRVVSVSKVYSKIELDKYSGEFEVYLSSIDEMFTLLVEDNEEGIRIN